MKKQYPKVKKRLIFNQIKQSNPLLIIGLLTK